MIYMHIFFIFVLRKQLYKLSTLITMRVIHVTRRRFSWKSSICDKNLQAQTT